MNHFTQILELFLKVGIIFLSFPRKWESNIYSCFWIPVFTGMTSISHSSRKIKFIKVLSFVIIFFTSIIPQQIDFQSTQNIKLFADYLFCDKDYLRAIEEYEKYLTAIKDDSVQFKIALGYSLINDQTNSLGKMNLINMSSQFYEQSRIERLKSLFLQNIDSVFYSSTDELINSNSPYSKNAFQFKNTSLLLVNKELPVKEKFLIPFEDQDKPRIEEFYNLKKEPPYKSEALAGILSAIVPGSGKIYTENYGDGITAFLFTGLFTYLAYTNFDNEHSTRAWIFTALGAGFYAGNVYGSIASVQIFNAKINFEFEQGVRLFLEDKNYFAPVYDFCK